MLKRCLIFVICTSLMIGCTAQEESPEPAEDLLLVGVDPNYRPFEFRNDDTSQVKGFDIDLMRAVGQFNGWQVEFREVPFDQLITSLTGGQIGAAISAITITPQREAVVDFSDPYYLTGQSLVVRKTDTSVSALSDLRGRRVGAQKGTTGEYLAKNTEGALVFRYDDIAEAFEYLLDGELDAVVNDCPSTRTYLRSHEGLRIADPDLDVAYYAIAVPRNSPELLTAVNEALAVLIGDGTYDSLHLRWFGYSWSEEPACDSPGDSLNQ